MLHLTRSVFVLYRPDRSGKRILKDDEEPPV